MSVLMGAYNYEEYVGRAITSALAQDYPSQLLEVIVVDDGSQDGTADVVQELVRAHPGRITLIRQENAGPTAATNRALREARGELLCLLDADDMWLPQKTRRQVEALQRRPELGLVFSDMRVVDANERTIRESHTRPVGDIPERAFPRLLWGNVATQSSIMVRASLREHFDPIPAEIPYADWWLTLRAAQFTAVDYVREPLALYRIHGANLTGNVKGAAKVREHRKYIAFQRWALRHLELDSLTPSEIAYVWSGVEENARQVLEAARTYFAAPISISDAEAADAAALLQRADTLREHGDLMGEARTVLRALACDPCDFEIRERLTDSLTRVQEAEQHPHPLAGTRGYVVMADAEELLADEDLLIAYGEALAGCEAVTLVIDASRLPGATVGARLQDLVARCGLADREDVDLLALTDDLDAAQLHRAATSIQARFSRATVPAADLPSFTPESLSDLLAAAEGATTARDPETLALR